MTRHRVLWLTKGLGRGGAEQLLVSSLPYIDPARFDVEVAYLVPWKNALVPRLTDAGVRVHCLNQRSNRDVAWAARLRRLVRSGAFDLVHTHMPIPAVAARVALAGPRPALVHTEHNLWSRYRRATYWANALTYGRNDKVIAVSHAVAASICLHHVWGEGPRDIEVLHHGIDTATVQSGPEARSRARATLGLADDEFVVGTVGNFTPKKDQRTLIDALALLRREAHNAVLVLIGTGPLEGDLRRHASDLGLCGYVRFAGLRDDVPALLPGFDVFALSSRYEGLSIALLEALAAHLPVVVTNVGGMPEVVSDEVHGLLVRSGSASDLAAGIRRLIDDPGLRSELADRGARRAATFDITRVLERIESIYDEVLAAR